MATIIGLHGPAHLEVATILLPLSVLLVPFPESQLEALTLLHPLFSFYLLPSLGHLQALQPLSLVVPTSRACSSLKCRSSSFELEP